MTRRYSDEEKAQAVRLVRQLRKELGADHATVQRVASQFDYGVETVRKWAAKLTSTRIATSSESSPSAR